MVEGRRGGRSPAFPPPIGVLRGFGRGLIRAGHLGDTAGRGQIRRIQIILAGNPDQGEQGIAAGVGQRRAHPVRGGRLATGQTGQSEETHSPEECASVVVSRISPAASSIEVVWTVAISCRPSDLRTRSNPLDKEA